ncbi:MAG: class II glutamine amidotransferase [Inquilinus sp.]|nr:class II glutamine amidotransferase [Inquilinus sp.]
MCELFAMSSLQPATVSFSLERFARRGGGVAPNRDGWGVVAYDEGDVRCLREPFPAASSPLVRFIERHPPCSGLVVSHIRRATVGGRLLKNTQPFCRDLGGRIHVFAHNGHLAGLERTPASEFGCHRPVGDTDSEAAFGVLLRRLEGLWAAGRPPLQARLDVVAAFAAELRPHGPANFLYGDGEILFAHGHRRHQADGRIAPPGLHLLCRECAGEQTPLAGEGIAIASPRQQVALVASVPLTDEAWRPLAPGELIALSAGRVAAALVP